MAQAPSPVLAGERIGHPGVLARTEVLTVAGQRRIFTGFPRPSLDGEVAKQF